METVIVRLGLAGIVRAYNQQNSNNKYKGGGWYNKLQEMAQTMKTRRVYRLGVLHASQANKATHKAQNQQRNSRAHLKEMTEIQATRWGCRKLNRDLSLSGKKQNIPVFWI